MASGAGETHTCASGMARAKAGAERSAWERDACARLEAELASLPPLGSPGLRSLVRWESLADAATPISPGALVALLRRAAAGHDPAVAEEIFVSLLKRCEGSNRQWAARVVARTPSLRTEPQLRASVREDLKQELTLYLWQRLAREHDPAWELYFARALTFAQRRVARAYMERNGYWPASGAADRPERLPALLLSRLAEYGDDSRDEASSREERLATPEQARDEEALTLADLADLRGLVMRLPERERMAVVMRFWLAAREHEIASALGVTTRTVRNLLARAYARLRRAYGEPGDAQSDDEPNMRVDRARARAYE